MTDPAPLGDPWLRAVRLALTGQDPAEDVADEEPGPDPEALVAALASSGWDRDRLREHRMQCQQAEQAWPHPLPADLVRTLGAGQLHAVLASVRRLTGLTGLHRTHRVGPAVLGPAEQRLLADRPPHHGNV
ncbi:MULTISPECIES: hypothetical protein [Aestuariimicrobium]|uniref:hypothetical protein n=1 Tax=Aestuariimicrobium TaxID=396388 RepID=UPI0003B5F664|nr:MULTISPECIES: hypothetical protein [Aestuariimicrobium]